ncbi:MAG: tetratricopeptide repeat protein [Phycisphaerae bacterium]
MKGKKGASCCPHCGGQLTPAGLRNPRIRIRGLPLARCRDCGFVYPEDPGLTQAPDYRDHNLLPVDRYRLISPLRAQGPGRVYLARHLVLDEPCVVKILTRGDPGYCEDACRRFIDEAKAGFRIKHPNVARVLDCDHSGDSWYFVMEYAQGANLGVVVRTCGRLSWPQVARIGIQTAEGLAAIHQAGLLHRDIKPSNLILRPDGTVKITDLGLSRMLDENPRIQIRGLGSGETHGSESVGLGTPQYMAPEMREAAGEPDERSDLYSLGATLYHLLVGRAPQRGQAGPLGYLTGGDNHAAVQWPHEIVPPVPKWLQNVVEKCLSPAVDQRFGSAAALSRELADWIEATDSAGGTVQVPGQTTGWKACPTLGAPKGVVVLPFRNLSSDQADDWLGEALAEEIHRTLLMIEGVQVVDRHELLALLGRMYAESLSEIGNAQILEAARLVGAAVVVRGGFQKVGGRVMAGASDITAAKPTDSSPWVSRTLARVTGEYEDIIDVQARLAKEVAEALGYQWKGARKDSRTSGRTSGVNRASRGVSRAVSRHYAASRAAFVAGRYAKAIEHAQAGLCREADSLELLSLMGVCHSRLGRYDEAITHHKRFEAIAHQRDDPYRLVEAAANLGTMYYFKGEYPRAYELLQRAAEMADELNLLPLLAKECNNIGFVLARMERLNEADQAFEEAIRIKMSLGATASLVSPYNGRGEIALRQGRWHDALRFYGQALSWALELEDHVNVGVCHTNIGRCHVQLGDYDQAEQHLATALDNLQSTEFWNGTTVAFEELAELHLIRRQTDAAFECIEKRIDLAQRHANRHMEAAAWEQKARAYELARQKDEAMECMRKSFQLQQSKSPYEPVSRRRRRSCIRRASPFRGAQ